MIDTFTSNPLAFVISFLALVIVIAIHEFAHAWAADHLGDPTPKLQGRLTLNPLKHLDPIGTLLILFIGFGWGKPVVFDPYNLQNPRKDAALISLAGPVSNFILALILSILLRSFNYVDNNFLSIIGLYFLEPVIRISIILGVFNLLPVHPLDGFKIVGGVLPEHKAEEWYALQKYGMFILIFLIFPLNGQSSMLDLIMRPVLRFVLPIFVPSMQAGVL